MIAKILIALGVIILIFVIVVASRPADFSYRRTATISAPPSAVFPHVNDLHKWQAWSPWAKKDPAAKNTFEGPPAGVGSSMSWAGNNDVGEGTMSVTGSEPDESVRFKLEFRKPFAGTNFADFTFKPEGGQTVVTWTMTGKNTFFFKAFSLFVDCDKMIGGDFEKGLADLKKIVETQGAN
ncbi:SRPBCC family protein [Luteolibacter yonseiensis]|uniref:SRPBCC family protein n=1 Tax=Luteolibacter yonseiensis TaxID=1144680 RepID=A0A934VCE1_9BACT|nr:SRPBCC family protein [Luteolibacter yonseiensis]MBK1816876.1 SRPBCC family protein [Luteolibacter yonseiensis]